MGFTKFETKKREIIEMYNDYLFLKYYKKNVINDINKNVEIDCKYEKIKVIETLLNKFEFDEYIKILNKYVDLFKTNKGYGIMHQMYLEFKEDINNRDIEHLIIEDCTIDDYIYEMKTKLKSIYLNKEY